MPELPIWIKIVNQIGFPIAVTIVLLFVFYPIMMNVQAQHDLIMTQTVADIDQTKVQIKLLRVICRNVATTEFERANCDI